ncbi:efflux RND transporter periplasmic adaptor subunit [Prolixibacter denitrificans]|uniref:Biotin carboxyl carrier protein n=2 Tax=Prolixibacter denitrificans TaxID=1541063 RepID=A0A2P8C5R2_9BACT|nr:HlyD family efflux transporter periplasmic adaptor subunit [Prolixibacter denitrificans]PSK80303.1 biotin carboxyl carrier protein [Prolixibacter denitrificans]
MPFMKRNSIRFSLLTQRYLMAGAIVLTALTFSGCSQKKSASTADPSAPLPEVQVTHVRQGTVQQTVQLNATAVFRRQHVLKSPVTGYVVKSFAEPGQMVRKGDPVFVIETKESRALGNSLDSLNRKLGLSGRMTIRASVSGYVAAISHQTGDFVPEGEPLATINDRNSMVFILNIPVEWPSIIRRGESLPVQLPDGRKLSGVVTETLPSVDQAAQTRQVIIRVDKAGVVPEGLIAKVSLVQQEKANTQILPKAAVLANETENHFWVMKMHGKETAVKVPVTTGIQTADSVEILAPQFQPSDEILTTGNYGVPDTLNVKVIR